MNDVRTTKFANEQRPVPELGDERSEVFDAQQSIDRRGGRRIDRDDPRVDRGVAAPCVQQPTRLDGMPANNPSRRDHDGNPESMWQGILHTAEMSGASGCKAYAARQRKTGPD